jgi:hypothetical protein
MRNRNFILITIALFLLCSACVGTRIRENVLIPSVQLAWPNVRADIEYGLMDAVYKEQITSEDSAFTTLQQMDDAVTNGIYEDIIVVPYYILEPYGEQGIQAKIDTGELVPETARFLFDRLKNFRKALDTLKKSTSYLPGPSKKREYWVMTDRGSLYYGTTQPPPTSTVNYPAISGYMQYRYGRR